MKTSIQPLAPKRIVQLSGDSSQSSPCGIAGTATADAAGKIIPQGEATFSALRNPGRPFVWVALLAGLLLLFCSAPSARAQGIPPGCTGSAIGISLFTSAPDVHIGDTLFYSVSVFNGLVGNPLSCDASNIVASITTPDGVIHPIVLRRTYLSHTQSDFYTNVVSYVVRAQDIRPDGTVRTTAEDTATIYQNDTPSNGGANQGVNTEVSQPCIALLVQCVGGVGENGLITFTGTVTNCGNNTLVGVTVTNFVNGGQFHVTFITNLLRGQIATFSGSWVPLNPCSPSTATFVAQGIDQFTANPRTVTSSTDTTCQNTLTPGIKVTKVCGPPVSPGQLLTFSGSVSNTGNVTLTNIVVVNSQPAANTQVFTRPTLAPGEVVSFNGSYTAPANCSVADTLTATAATRCGVGVSSIASATCPILTTPGITVTEVCPITPGVSGGSSSFSGVVRNSGDITLNNVVVVSDRPSPNTVVFTAASLAPGASGNYSGTFTVPLNVCTVTTAVRATGTDSCSGAAVTNTATATCPITTAPAIAVTLACPATPVATGGLITYTGTVRNSGNVTLNNVTVVNNQASPSTVLTVASLAPGDSANFTASFTAPADACSVSSTVTGSGSDNCTGTVVNNSASATCTLVTTPRITVTQNCPLNPPSLDGVLTYSGTVMNTGNITLTNVVVTNDRTGASPVFTVATLAPGASANFTGSYTVPANSTCAVTSTLTANARDKCTATLVTANATATCPVQGAPNIAVTLTCPSTPTPLGGLLTFSGTVRNAGNVTLTNVVVRRDAPSPNTVVFSAASLAPGASANFSGSYTVPGNNTCSITTSVSASANDQCAGSGVIASATIDCPLVTAPRILVTQTCPANPVAPGGRIVYDGSVSNPGNVTLTNITVVGSQPAPNTVVFTLASLAPGASASFSSSFNAPLDACSATSTLTATGRDQCNGNPVNNSVTTTCPLVTAPQITVTKACPITPVTEGGLLVFTGTVTNTGNITLTNIFVVNNRPTANTTVLGPITLSPGAGTNFSSSYTAPLNACSVTDTLTASGRDKCTGSTVTNSITETCPIATVPQIAVTLNCPAVPAATGGPITFSGTVRNSGNVTLNNVTVVNSQAVSSTVLTVPSLAPGASANFTANFTAPADACSVSSTVTARGSDACTSIEVSASASANCTLATTPSIEVTQTCPVSPANPGGLLTYSGTVRNAGNITLTDVVVLNNLSGATPVFTKATLAPGEVVSYTGSYTAPANTCSSTSASTATGRSICGVAVTHTVSATCPILTAPQIAVTAVCPTTPIVPGSVLTYSGTVRNTGNITLTNVVVVSDRPAANTTVFTAATLAPGASAPYTASFTVPPTDCSVTTTVNATGKDICTGATTANSAAITCTVATAPSIAVTLACPVAPVATGGLITYTGTVRNSGNVALNNVVVVNNQASPSAVLTVPSLAPGASMNFTASFTAPADACSVSSAVTASGSDNCTGTVVNNSASATCTLTTTPSIAVTQDCPTTPTSPGGIATYSGTVRNTGNITLTNVVVTSGGSVIAPSNTVTTVLWVDDAVPAGAVLTSFGGDSWNWVSSNPSPFSGTQAHQSNIGPGTHQHVFKFATDTLPINVGDTLIAYVYLDPANVPSEVMLGWHDGSTFEHRAYWGANNITELGTDGTASRRYMGPLPAVGQWVRLEVPASLVGLEGRTVGGMAFTLYGGRATWDAAGKVTQTITPPPTGGTVVFTAATLAPGAVADFTVSYTVSASSGCSFISALNASGADPCTGARVTANVSTTCPLVTAPAIVVTQTCPATPVLQGGLLTYSGTVSNAGNITLTNVIVVNNQPAANTVIFTVATLAPGARANFTGSYQVPLNCCLVSSTVGATGQDICTGVTVADTFTATCTVLTMPQIVVTKVCPPTAVRTGQVLEYSGTVSNAGNITLVEVTIVNTQPSAGSPVLGPIILAPGESVSYYASYVVAPDFCGTDTVTARGLDACSFAPVVNSVTTTCPVITTPRIFVTKTCPPTPTPHLGVLNFTGTVSNPGNVTLNNVFVVNNQPTNNTPVIGPITLAPGESVNFAGSYITPEFCCQIVDTLTARGQDRCSGAQVAATATAICPLLNTPLISVTKNCPTNPVPAGGLFVFSGSVSNSGDTILTNVYVVSSQPSPNTPLLGPIELAPGERKVFSGSYTVTASSNPQLDTVTARGMNTCAGITTTATANCLGPVTAPAITSVTLANGMATVTWTATPGVTYRLQCGSNSQNSVWINIPGDVTASGATASKNDAVGSTTQRFYRVMVVQ